MEYSDTLENYTLRQYKGIKSENIFNQKITAQQLRKRIFWAYVALFTSAGPLISVQDRWDPLLIGIMGILCFGGFYSWLTINYVYFLRGKGYGGIALLISLFISHWGYEFLRYLLRKYNKLN